MKRSPTDDAWRDAAIREVMRSDVVTIDAHAPVREALRLLADNGISGMPVTDGAGGVVGVISMRDVLEHLAESADEEHEGEGADYAALEEEEETEEPIVLPGVVQDAAKKVLTTFQMGFYDKVMAPKVYGRAFIPQNRNTIVVSNHASHLDMAS